MRGDRARAGDRDLGARRRAASIAAEIACGLAGMSTCVAGYAADDRRSVNLKVEPVLAQISRRGDRLHSASAACVGRMARSFR